MTAKNSDQDYEGQSKLKWDLKNVFLHMIYLLCNNRICFSGEDSSRCIIKAFLIMMAEFQIVGNLKIKLQMIN